MNLRRLVPTPVEERDRQELTAWCRGCGVTLVREVEPRHHYRLAGEVRSMRVVRTGSSGLVVVVDDGTGSVTALFRHRDAVAGITPGARVEVEGVVVQHDGRLEVLDPVCTRH